MRRRVCGTERHSNLRPFLSSLYSETHQGFMFPLSKSHVAVPARALSAEPAASCCPAAPGRDAQRQSCSAAGCASPLAYRGKTSAPNTFSDGVQSPNASEGDSFKITSVDGERTFESEGG